MSEGAGGRGCERGPGTTAPSPADVALRGTAVGEVASHGGRGGRAEWLPPRATSRARAGARSQGSFGGAVAWPGNLLALVDAAGETVTIFHSTWTGTCEITKDTADQIDHFWRAKQGRGAFGFATARF